MLSMCCRFQRQAGLKQAGETEGSAAAGTAIMSKPLHARVDAGLLCLTCKRSSMPAVERGEPHSGCRCSAPTSAPSCRSATLVRLAQLL